MATTVTYDPQDDKLRIYFALRQPEDILAPLKEAGYRWAGAQGCWFAVWTPQREDVALALDGVDGIDDEPGTLEDRATARSDRFDTYASNAAAERDQRHSFVNTMVGALNGQPVLIGHHSEKRHRKLLQRMDDSMRAAYQAEKRRNYWDSRSDASLAWARRKEAPAVRARRIKTLEADLRRVERNMACAQRTVDEFTLGTPLADLLAFANDGRNRLPFGTWSTLRGIHELPGEEQDGVRIATVEAAQQSASKAIAGQQRWLSHLQGRIAYERDQLGEQVGEDSAANMLARRKPSKGKAAVPMLNLPGGHPLTKAEWSKIHSDYKGSRVIKGPDGKPTHRVRTAMHRSALVEVTISDAKIHALPTEVQS